MTGSIVMGGAGETSSGGAWVLDPAVLFNVASVGVKEVLPVTAGDVTVAVPQNAIVAVVELPTGCSACRLRTNANAADQGLPLKADGLASPLGPTLPAPVAYPIGPGVTELILNFSDAFPEAMTILFM